MLKTLKAYVGEYKKTAIAAPVFIIFEVIFEMIIPLLMSEIIDNGLGAGNINYVVKVGIIMLLVSFASLFCGAMAARQAAIASAGFAKNVREGMYNHIQEFSFSNIDHFSTAGLVTRLTTDVTNVQMAFQMMMRMFTRAPITLIAAMFMAFMINSELSMVFLVALVFLGFVVAFLMSRVGPYFRAMFDQYDALNASVQENVSGIRVVKAFVREDYENKKFSKAAEQLCRLFIKAESLLALNNPIMMLVIYGCIICLSWFGAHFIVAGTLTTGNLTSLFSYVMSMMMSLMMLSMVFVMISMSAASARRIAQVLEEKPDLADPDQPVTEVEDGRIDFNHVSFSYKHGSGEAVLHDIDLHILPGETVGIIGGTNVSGGQKQRLCIARALLKKPKVLILDDSTSAVDTATDGKIREAFAKKIPGTTKLIISQRISSVQDADRILVLEEGKVSGFDTHEKLLKTNSIYREIYEAQIKSGGDFDEKAG